MGRRALLPLPGRLAAAVATLSLAIASATFRSLCTRWHPRDLQGQAYVADMPAMRAPLSFHSTGNQERALLSGMQPHT